MNGRCKFCAGQIDATTDYREITGFERLRQSGGANQITLRKETGAWVCRTCVERLRRGVSIQQLVLE